MLDLNTIRKEPKAVAEAARRKGIALDVQAIVAADEKVRATTTAADTLRATKKHRGAEIPTLTGSARSKLLTELKTMDAELTKLETDLRSESEKLNELLLEVPNLVRPDVPDSQSEKDNVVVRTWGKPRTIEEAKDHVALGTALGILDIDRATKLSGTRFAILRGAGAALELALVGLAREHLEAQGFELVLPPVLIKAEHMQAMGYLSGGGESETYHFEKDNLYLVGTSEQALGPMYSKETFPASEMPKRLLGYSPCFRRESGSYGKDTKGLIRVHQFDKTEMFAFTLPSESDAEHERFLRWEEELMQKLELPYRVLNIVSGALGYPAARRYDIETWFPSRKEFVETHSTSTTTDFQTRRLGVRVKTESGTVYAHAVNGTVFTGRTVAALIENGQQKDGSVVIPKVLADRVGFDHLSPR